MNIIICFRVKFTHSVYELNLALGVKIPNMCLNFLISHQLPHPCLKTCCSHTTLIMYCMYQIIKTANSFNKPGMMIKVPSQ